MTRREFVTFCASAAAALGSSFRALASGPAQKFEVTHTDAEWRKLLTAPQYAVLRQEATERPFTSTLLHEKRHGTFACAGCALDVFSSETKFDSGTGWPSFWAPIEHAIGTSRDISLGMTEHWFTLGFWIDL